MKKLIGFLMLTLFALQVDAQRISLTKTAETATKNATSVQVLENEVAYLTQSNDSLQANLENIKADVQAVIAQSKEDLKVPTTVAEAEDLLAYVMSLVMFIIVGFIPADKLPKWLSKFVISIILGIIITVVAYFGSGGEFTIGEAVTFFLAIAGGSNVVHQIKKHPKALTTATEPTPVPL